MPDINEFIAGLPKVELHVHHVGSASPRTVAALAARHEGSTSVPADPDQLREYFVFTDFAHFIDVYLSVVDLIRTPEDVELLTYEVAADLAAQNVRYVELTLTPYFARARAAGLHSVPHAGESTGPETIWEALDHLGAERIGHGIAAVHDPELLARLAREGIPLEVCPTSNICTRSVPSLAEHPLPALVEAGVPVSINSDDPPMFGTTLNQEYAVAAELLDLDHEGVAALAADAVRMSFLPSAEQDVIRSEIDAYVASQTREHAD